jgi:hypothetical protein
VPVFGKVVLFCNSFIGFEVVDDFHDAELRIALVRATDVKDGLEHTC